MAEMLEQDDASGDGRGGGGACAIVTFAGQFSVVVFRVRRFWGAARNIRQRCKFCYRYIEPVSVIVGDALTSHLQMQMVCSDIPAWFWEDKEVQ